LRAILHDYENRVWVEMPITKEKIHESDLAEAVAEQERLLLHNRRELIRKRLQAYSLTQKDLGKILGHASVSYISELVNGISPFTIHDLFVIHLLLKIEFKDLIPTMLNLDERSKITEIVNQLSNTKLKINKLDLALITDPGHQHM